MSSPFEPKAVLGNLSHVSIDQSGGGSATLAAAVSGKRTYLMALVGTMTSAGTMTVKDNSDTQLSGEIDLDDKGGVALPHTGWPHLRTAVGKGMKIVTTQAFNGWALVYQE